MFLCQHHEMAGAYSVTFLSFHHSAFREYAGQVQVQIWFLSNNFWQRYAQLSVSVMCIKRFRFFQLLIFELQHQRRKTSIPQSPLHVQQKSSNVQKNEEPDLGDYQVMKLHTYLLNNPLWTDVLWYNDVHLFMYMSIFLQPLAI